MCFPRGMGRLRNLRKFRIYQSLGFIPRALMTRYIFRRMVRSGCHKRATGGLKFRAVGWGLSDLRSAPGGCLYSGRWGRWYGEMERQPRMKMGISAEVGAPLKSLPPTPQWPRIRRGLWSGSNFLGASLYLPWDLLGPSEAGAGPPALPQWTARTCQRCWAPGFGSGEGVPHPASPAYSWLPSPASERRRYPAGGAPRPPPCRSALLGAVPAGGLSCALGPDVSASRAVSLETLLHGDGLPGRHTPFLWAWAAAA